jgi:hypothetical protein
MLTGLLAGLATREVRKAHRLSPRPLAVECLEARQMLAGDAVLDWNAVALDAVAKDSTFATPDQGGPTRTARALAIVHVAIYDAVDTLTRAKVPFTNQPLTRVVNIDAAIATAAHTTLVSLFPKQKADLNAALADYLDEIPNGLSENLGRLLGWVAGVQQLVARHRDGSSDMTMHMPSTELGHHQPDPLHPDQGYLTPKWGEVDPFGVRSATQFRAPPPPSLDSTEYAAAFDEVMRLGAIDAESSDRDGDGELDRTPEQTEIGLFWAYDGMPMLGTPPRLYNQIVRVVSEQEGNTLGENARLFALVNMAMADAGIAGWESKYYYDFWRPIVGIRAGNNDGNPLTDGDPNWQPLGAPASNVHMSGADFTPPFPAYVSGHATFGAATFRMLANFYGTDDIAFSFQSDELNGVTTGSDGQVRPAVTRHFDNFSEAAQENAESRIYLGIHWRFDAEQGIAQGNAIADWIYTHSRVYKAKATSSLVSTFGVLATIEVGASAKASLQVTIVRLKPNAPQAVAIPVKEVTAPIYSAASLSTTATEQSSLLKSLRASKIQATDAAFAPSDLLEGLLL